MLIFVSVLTIHAYLDCYVFYQCEKFRQKCDQSTRNKMREKVTASDLFRDRKVSYPMR